MMTQQLKQHDIVEEEYNAAPYLSLPFLHTHPTHLYTLATLFGLTPKPIEKCRVLELGCASGGNLLPMAYHFSHSEFVGIDLSAKQIDEGSATLLELNLKNITLRHQSILDFKKEEGKFDYIICHGVYSWVDKPVQDKILQICHENLAQGGIAYVSYNTFPGWNMVNSVRDLMKWHTRTLQDPPAKAEQARSVLKFLVDGLQEEKSPYAEVLRQEINLLSKQRDSYLLHEHLSTYNNPVYFYQFMEHATKHHLSYLSDAFLVTMFTDNLPPQFANELKKINNIVLIGQYMDFIRNQRFRSTLLCHQEQKINRALKTNSIEPFYLQLAAKCSKNDFSEKDLGKEEIVFSNASFSLKIRNPHSQLAMLILNENIYKPMHYDELCQQMQARSSLTRQEITKILNEDLNLMRAVFAGLIQISSYPGNYLTEVRTQPYACPLARSQAKKQNFVTNRRHQTIMLDPVSKLLLPHLDGKHTQAQLINIINEQIENGTLSMVNENKDPIKEPQEIKKRLESICHNTLDFFAKQALLLEP